MERSLGYRKHSWNSRLIRSYAALAQGLEAGKPGRSGAPAARYLELEGTLGAVRDVLVETLLGVVGQLEGDLGGAAGPRRHQQQREQPAAPLARGGRPALRGPRPPHPRTAAAASTELGTRGARLRGLGAAGLGPGRPRRRTAGSLGASERFATRGESRGAGEGRRDTRPGPRTTQEADTQPAANRQQTTGKGLTWPEVGGDVLGRGAGPEGPAPATRMCSPRAADRGVGVRVSLRGGLPARPLSPRGGARRRGVARLCLWDARGRTSQPMESQLSRLGSREG